MRALTLTQPWCGLVASGTKLVENRPRPMIKREDFRKPFALHASREIDESVYYRIGELAPELMEFDRDDHARWPAWYRLSRVTSSVIGVASISDAMYIGGCSPAGIADAVRRAGLDPDQERWTFGPTVYVLPDARALATAVPCRGWQGFWNMTSKEERERGEVSAVERAVLAQVGRSAIPNHSEDHNA